MTKFNNFVIILILLKLCAFFTVVNRVYAMEQNHKNYQPKILKIVHFGNPILYKKTRQIDNVLSDDISHVAQDMVATLGKDDSGAGLAAPQVDIPLRIFVYRLDTKKTIYIVINPKIEIIDQKKITSWEGCLSLPNIVGAVPRYKKIRVKYQTLEGKTISKIVEDDEARIFQHETDHLDGIVYVQRIKDFSKFGFIEELNLRAKAKQ